MFFWFAAAALTVAATLAAIWPLFRPASREAAVRAEHDVEVYRAQMRELERDVERGTLSPDEAETARAEIGRRLLKADRSAEQARAARKMKLGTTGLYTTAAMVVIGLPLMAVLFYTTYGAAGLPDVPLASRERPDSGTQTEMAVLVSRAEERLRTNPDDGQGWNVLAPIYLRTNQPAKAETAFRNAIRLLGSTAPREAGLGEALTQKAGGEVTPEAESAFVRALEANPGYLPARFFIALDHSQEGKLEEAEAAWSELIAMSPEGAPWLQIADAALADTRAKLGKGGDEQMAAGTGAGNPGGGTPAASAPAAESSENTGGENTGGGNTGSGEAGPTEADIASAAAMSAEDRMAMIQGMVSQLAQRLENEPDDVEGWKRLIRSYAVLGEEEQAREAFRTASRTFEGDAAAAREIAAIGEGLGFADAEEETR